MSQRAPGSLVLVDSLSDLVSTTGEAHDWSDIVYVLRGLEKAAHRWGGVILAHVNRETLSSVEHGQLIDACSGTFRFQWETGGSTRARTLVVKQFRGVLSRIEAENIGRFETELGDAGFDISDVRKIR
jgi:archaellum biogenesis ATPase FlaH